MEIYFWVCVVVFQSFNVISAHHDKQYTKDPLKETGDMFASVIQNITRVNKELQQLIHKYEAMQKTYAITDNSGTDTLTVESNYESEEKVVKEKRSNDNVTAVTSFSATQIIWSNEDVNKQFISYQDEDSSSKEDNSNSTEDTHNTSRTNQLNKTEIIFIDTLKTTEEIRTEPTIPPTKVAVTSTPLQTTNNMKININKEELKEQESSKVEHDEVQDTEDTVSDNLSESSDSNVHKLRSYKSNNSETSKLKNIEITSFKERIPLVEKKLYSETFSAKKIWDEIINNKPIRLEVMRKNMKSDSRKSKTAVIIVTNNQTKNKIDKAEDLSEDTVMEETRTTVLREADACLQLVVRKCYKAMKAVIKSICYRYKCKNSFREKFLEYSKTGCLQNFLGNKTKNEDKKIDDDIFYRNKKVLDRDGNQTFVDTTRSGYFSACLPHIESQLKETKDDKEPTRSQAENFNILRDRFEKACADISMSKCKEAGKYATTQICEAYPCSSSKMRSFRKACERQCKNIYRSYGDSSSSDSSDSDSDSDSGSSS